MTDKTKTEALTDKDLDAVTGGDKLGNFEIQDLKRDREGFNQAESTASSFNQAETLASSVMKKTR